MDIAQLNEILTRNRIILIISAIVLLIFLVLIFSVPSFSDELVEFDEFSVRLPSDAEYMTLSNGGIKVTGPPREYHAEIFKTKDVLPLYNEVLDEMNLEGSAPVVTSYNDTHYLVRCEITFPIESDVEMLYNVYHFHVPKDSYDIHSFKLKDPKEDVWVIRAEDIDFPTYLDENIKFGG